MYTLLPDQSKLPAFVPMSLVRVAEKDFSVKSSELLEMRQAIEQMADDLRAVQPDLIPFFATGGIPFMFPVMHVLYDRMVVKWQAQWLGFRNLLRYGVRQTHHQRDA